jgi:RimJ/RimL family protein N-acetyltransferase
VTRFDPKNELRLRDVSSSDLDSFFRHQVDETSNWMAAFTAEDPRDRSSFQSHWEKILSDRTAQTQTIVWNGQVVGHVACFDLLAKRSVDYWIDREVWGRGIATEALRQFLQLVGDRPLFARVAADNLGSIRVLEKSGFRRIGEERNFAPARRAEVEEFLFQLDER